MVDGDGASCCRCGRVRPGLPAGGAAQCFVSRVSRSIWLGESALVLRSMRFSLIDLPDFFDIECRGDLSAIACSLIGSLSGSVSGQYAAPLLPALRLAGRRAYLTMHVLAEAA